MKKTLATLLVFAMVLSVFSMIFVSAEAELPAKVVELEKQLAELVGSVEDADYNWSIETTVEGDKVTAVVTVEGAYEHGINYVSAMLCYDAEALTILNEEANDGTLDCVTSPVIDGKTWESTTMLNKDDDANVIPGEIVLSVFSCDNVAFTDDVPLVFTLEFQLNDGADLAGLAIPSAGLEALDYDLNEYVGQGAYAVVYIAPVENTKVEVDVNETPILTDGKTGFTGAWGAVGTNDVALVANGNCTKAGMDVTLSYALGATKLIDSVTVDLYHDANVMIGYPEGQATVLVSVDGETWTEAGKYDLAAADLAVGKYGTVSNVFAFEAVEAAYVKVLLYAGSNEAVLGATPAGGKIFWEFISVAEFAVNEVKIPTNLAAGKEWTGDTEIGSGYKGDITDGKIDPDGKYDTSIWYGFDQRNSGDSVGTIIIDLGAIYTNIDEIRAFVWPAGASGIAVPVSYDFYVSNDGETYTLVTSVAGAKSNPTWVGTDNEEGLTARYVKLDIVGTANDTFWFIGELEVNSYEPKIIEVAVPAEPGNLAAGKEWTGDTEIGSGYKGDITDGKIDPDGKYDTSIWYGFDQRKSGDSVGTIIIDLGKLYSGLDEIRAFVWPAGASGIAVPVSYNFYISEDGETYTLVTSVAGAQSGPTWVGTDNEESFTARYVKLDIVGTDKDTFWFIGELEVNVFEPEPEIPEIPDDEKTYENTLTVGENGNASVEVPYGYTWLVNYVNGKIGGEDVTICTTDEAYKACNPNWAITILLEKQEDGTYVAVADAVVTPGNADKVTVGENQIALVVHSASSNPDGGYANWLGKVVALSVKEGQVFLVSADMTSVYAVKPGEEVEPEIPHEHAYNKTVTVEPSLVDGVATYTCECGDSYTEAIPAVKVQPETLETLPEGALVFDYAGYVHDSFFCIVAGDNLTVNELTALGNNGAGKDMNYFYVIVVDENGVVVETHFTLGRPDGVKSDVVCPAGGYIIAFNGNKAGADELTKVEVGAEITLYNIDVEALRGVAGNVTVKDAGFTYENPAPVEPDEPSEPEVSEPDEPSEPEVSEPDEPSEEPEVSEPEVSEPEEPKHWEDTLQKGENGNYTVDYPYGYVWDIDYVDGKIGGEDITIVTSDEAYKACNPNWAITILLEKQADGSYVAVQNAIITPGNANAITIGENQIALVVHSSASNPEAGYENWTGKVVAMSVKAGDKFDIDLDEMTVVAVDPNAPVEPEVSEPEEPSDTPDLPVTGDASVLVFAILGVLAIVGAAVVIKVRN